MSRSPSKVPVPKVVAAGLGAASATVVVVTIQAITGGEIPTGLEGALATLFAFAAGYITPPAGIGEDDGEVGQ